jgi:transposase-like protein
VQRTEYTPEQKAEALAILAQAGKAEAARRTGIPMGTIGSWASRAGVTAPSSEVIAELNASRLGTMTTRKAALAEQLLGHAVRIAGQLDAPTVEKVVKVVGFGGGVSGTEVVEVPYDRPPTADQKRIAETVGVLIAQVQLLTGEATSRVETSMQVEAVKERALATVTELRNRLAS